MSGITLTTSESATILSLQQTNNAFNNVSEQLNTGKKVNSASDNALAFFQSQALYQRANDFQTRKATIDQSIQTVTAAMNATSTIGTLLNQIKGIISSVSGESVQQRASATAQVQNLGTQILQLVKDTQYQGVNLLESSAITLRTQFSERTASALVITGFNLVASTGGANTLFTQAGIFQPVGSNAFNFGMLVSSQVGSVGQNFAGFSQILASTPGGQAAYANAVNFISDAIQQDNALTAQLGTNVSILQARSTFSASYGATLSGGGDKLTLADLNLEAAESQALSLRQNVGIQDLSVENQVAQSILNLLK
ncbi:MAG TPA: hypothetical protein VL574_02125 [Stellaceae bacterium]|nr:hypothetical protein [Stellaceae bacterium]